MRRFEIVCMVADVEKIEESLALLRKLGIVTSELSGYVAEGLALRELVDKRIRAERVRRDG